ncbi:MAG TPA: MFS transporter [Xanthobacteraceae bacterium]|nr:MFS transporter [Xanthobacteraceae bacterium]
MTTTSAAILSPADDRRRESWQIALVSAAHFVSHYYIILLAPLFVFIRADYGVSYTELGFAFVAFNVVTALLQTPAGFLVDRMGAKPLLVAGVALGAAAIAVAAMVDSFWIFVAMFGVAGLANTVYHPADYTLLSQGVSPERMGHAFSIHTFAGMLGGAAAPASLLLLHAFAGWRGAFLGAAAFGFVIAAVLALSRGLDARRPLAAKAAAAAATDPRDTGWRLLLSWPILQSLLFFILLAIANAGLQNYSVVALGALFDTPLTVANTALSAYLLLTAIGVLSGGWVSGLTRRHALVAALGLCAAALVTFVIGMVDLGSVLLIVMMSAAGFLTGVIMPSRDLMVRENTPAGSYGKVFGFVTTGFNIGGIVSPLVFGWLMDNNSPRGVFLVVAAVSLASVITVLAIPKLRPSAR